MIRRSGMLAVAALGGCRILRQDEVFLLNPRSADSLDGRYFGPLPTSSVVGRAVPLWTIGEE